MKKQEKIVEQIYNSYLTIGFVKRYNTLFHRFDLNLDEIMTRMDKKENLKVMSELGYKFKIFTPGQHYNYKEISDDVKLVLSCQISKGMVFPYIYIYIKNQKIDYQESLSFIYRHLINNMNAPANALLFRNYEDLKEIMASVIAIYEDLKKEFLKRLDESNLLEK